MADLEEHILLDIEFNSADIQKNIQAIATARASIDSLLEANKKLAEQGQKNSTTYVKNEQAIKALNSEVATSSKVIQANTQAVKANEDSLKALKEENKNLLKQRDQLSTKTEEGRAAIAKLNAKYDENSKIIAANSTQVEKQRFNIGNYSSALDKLAPGLGKVATGLDTAAQGQKGLTTATKAFILTGIGAIIAAIVVAFQALKAVVAGSTAGMDKFEDVMSSVRVVLDVVGLSFK